MKKNSANLSWKEIISIAIDESSYLYDKNVEPEKILLALKYACDEVEEEKKVYMNEIISLKQLR